VVALLAGAVLAAAPLTLAGCGSGTAPSAAPASPTGAASPAASPGAVTASGRPAGNEPSVSAKMICEAEAQGDITSAIGVSPNRVSTPTWVDHVYSCRYEYTGGAMVLSVKELPDAATTLAYFNAMRDKHPGGGTVPGIGDAAYLAPDGSALVRKDFKVLWVDISGMPAQLGTPAVSRADAAYRTAVAIMGCWTGA